MVIRMQIRKANYIWREPTRLGKTDKNLFVVTWRPLADTCAYDNNTFLFSQLLGELLLDRHNFTVMTRYISKPENLKLMMNLLRDKSPNIQFEAFHVFKVKLKYCDPAREICQICICVFCFFPKMSWRYSFLYFFLGVCSKPQQNTAHHRHPAKEPDKTNRLLKQLPEGSHGWRAVQRWEDLLNQTDQGSEETSLLEEHLSLYPNFLLIGKHSLEKKMFILFKDICLYSLLVHLTGVAIVPNHWFPDYYYFLGPPPPPTCNT